MTEIGTKRYAKEKHMFLGGHQGPQIVDTHYLCANGLTHSDQIW